MGELTPNELPRGRRTRGDHVVQALAGIVLFAALVVLFVLLPWFWSVMSGI
jgi:hypothetical protein